MSVESLKCTDCSNEYLENEIACPKCGSKRKIVYVSCEPVTMTIGSEVTGMMGKNPHLTGKKKYPWEWSNKKTVRGDNGKPVCRYMLIDREQNWYEESVTDWITGEIIHECQEPLKDHFGHGSAKEK